MRVAVRRQRRARLRAGAASRRGARGSSGGVTLQGDLYGRPFTGGICMGAAEGGLGRDGVWRPAEVPSGAQLPGARSAVWRPATLFSPAGPTDYQ